MYTLGHVCACVCQEAGISAEAPAWAKLQKLSRQGTAGAARPWSPGLPGLQPLLSSAWPWRQRMATVLTSVIISSPSLCASSPPSPWLRSTAPVTPESLSPAQTPLPGATLPCRLSVGALHTGLESYRREGEFISTHRSLAS